MKRYQRCFAASLGWALVVGLAAPGTAGLTITDLRCEHLANPQGIDAVRPRLAWVLQSPERGQRQTACQILVASSPEKLAADQGDLWDSGKVESDQSLEVRYAGAPLGSHAQCYWKVRAWDARGEPSSWSESARWSMGLLDPADWMAKWIGGRHEYVIEYLKDASWIWFPEGDPTKAVPVGERYFRRVVELPADRKVREAHFLVTGDSQVKVFINGRDVGGRDTYKNVKDNDFTHRLKPGPNLIAIIGMNKGTEPKPAGVVGILNVDFDSGEPLVMRTDESWKATDKGAEGWNLNVDFDDSQWQAAKVTGPVGMQPWGDVRAPENRRLPAEWLRKEFAADKPVRRATVYLSGLGLSELYLNGQKVGDHVLSPGMTQYPKRVFYVTHDVTEHIRNGANAIGVVLGNGRYYSPRSQVYAGMPHYGFPKLLLHLRLEYEDGTTSEIVSDESWRLTADGPITANNEYDGEEYDARKELTGWSEVGYNDAAWQPVDASLRDASSESRRDSATLSAQMLEPIRVVESLKPIAINEPQPDAFIFDMGQNMVGWCRLKVAGPAGATVTLRHAETLNPHGTLYLANIRGARVTDKYTLKGGGPETWEPRFTYHGFRFVEVTGWPGKPTLDAVEGRVVHDDLRPVGEFECSNPLINQIYKNVVWGLRGNYRSVPTDCPQRDERQGWLGDRGEESKGEMYVYDVAALYSKWLQDMEDSQKDTGSVPDVCPAHWPIYSDNVTWPSSTVIIPGSLRRHYADEAVIARHYAIAKKWMQYMQQFVENGLISRDSYGDWCVPPEDPILIHSLDPGRQTDKTLLATAYWYYDLRLMEKYARLLRKFDDANQWGLLAAETKVSFNVKFYNGALGQYDNGSQTSCVLPLAFGLVPRGQHQRVFDRLVRKITDETKNHIGTGLIGGQFLNRELTKFGRPDLAYTIASQRDYPSWGYMISQGATTIWELWNGDTADPAMNSGNHVMLVGDLVLWLYENLAGIAPEEDRPGFKHIIMRPEPVGDLTYVKASHLSPHGRIASHWRRENGKFDWQITVPANTEATIYVPASTPNAVTEGSQPAAEAAGVRFLRMEEGRAVFQVGSGDYHFVSE